MKPTKELNKCTHLDDLVVLGEFDLLVGLDTRGAQEVLTVHAPRARDLVLVTAVANLKYQKDCIALMVNFKVI